MKLGRSVLEPLLAADGGYRGPRVSCGAGHLAEFVAYREKTTDTVLGPVTLSRAWYHCGDCGHGLAPRDAELGVAGQTMSPGLARMNDRAAAAVPFTPAARLVGELAGITLTGRRAGRRAEADGAAAARVIEAQAAAIAARQVVPLPPAAPLPDMLYIAIDGTGVPMIPAETEGRPGKAEDGKARTREVKLCCVFTQTSLDDKGRPVRDPHSSSYLATFAPASEFGVLMTGEARRRGAAHVRQLVILGDGAAWIWNLASQHFPEATQIVDLFHAREHLMGIWQATRYASTGRQALRADRGACPPGSRLNGNRPQRPSTDRRDLVTCGGGWRRVTQAVHQDLILARRSGTRRRPPPQPRDTPTGLRETVPLTGMGGRGRCHPQEPTPHSDGSPRAPARTGALRAAGVTNG